MSARPTIRALRPSRHRLLAAVLAWVVATTGAPVPRPAVAAAGERPVVAVAIPPHAWIARQVAGPDVPVLTVLRPGESPASFDPSPVRLARLADATLYLACGVPMESTLLPRLRSLHPGLRVVAPPPPPPVDGEPDPHLWLSPRRAIALVDSAAAGLARADPAHAEGYRRRAAAVHDTLRALSRELAARLAACRGRTVLVFHPALGHFAAEFGLRQRAIEHGGLEPSPRRVARLLEQARAEGITTVFVEPQFSATLAEKLARRVGLRVAEVDPLPDDLPAGLRRLAAAVAAGLACPDAGRRP